MKRIFFAAAVILLTLILASMLAFTVFRQENAPEPTEPVPQVSTESRPVETFPEETTEMPAETAVEEPAGPERFVITLTGDCTLGSIPPMAETPDGFAAVVGEDYDYPMANVREYFLEDDLSLVNFEGTLGNIGPQVRKQFNFRGLAAYTAILTGSSVEAVSLANNHSRDFGWAGYAETKRILDESGLAYVEHLSSLLFPTERGLTVGVFAADLSTDYVREKDILDGIERLKEDGAELILCAFRWGRDNRFRSVPEQENLGRAAIDAGAHIVWGHHPHVLQPIEQYHGGVIFYSLGNFVFGGNSKPKDFDTALVQQEVLRSPDGTIALGELTIVPCSISSDMYMNNYQPTPYPPGSEAYDRVLRKLNGTYTGNDLSIG